MLSIASLKPINEQMTKRYTLALSKDLFEAANDFDSFLVTDYVEFNGFVNQSDITIAEAATNLEIRLRDVYRLDEGFLDDVFGKAKEFFTKVVGSVSKIADKTDAYFMSMMGRTKEWLDTMRPRIEAAKKRVKAKDFEYEIYEWDIPYVMEGMLKDVVEAIGQSSKMFASLMSNNEKKGIMSPQEMNRKASKLVSESKKNVSNAKSGVKETDEDSIPSTDKFKSGQAISEQDAKRIRDFTGKTDSVKNEDNKFIVASDVVIKPESEKPAAKGDDIPADIESFKTATEDLESDLEDLTNNVCKEMGVASSTDSEGDSITSYVAGLMRKAHGDDDEPSKRTIHDDVDAMVKAIENADSGKKTLTEAYKGHHDALIKLADGMDSIDPKKIFRERGDDSSDTAIIRKYWKVRITHMANTANVVERVCNNAKNANLNAIRNMISDFMKALTAYSDVKVTNEKPTDSSSKSDSSTTASSSTTL